MISQWRRLAGALFFFSDAARRLSLAIARSAISLPGLLLVLTVATMALAAWGILWTDHHRRLDEQIRLGRAIAALTADWLDQAIAPAEAVARSEPARRLDRAALSPLLTDLVQTAPRVQAVNVTASRGEVIMASDALVTPRAGGRPVAAPRAADPATAPSSAMVSAVVVSLPIIDAHGQTIGQLETAVDLADLQALIRALPLPPAQRVSIIDRDRQLVASHGVNPLSRPIQQQDLDRLRSQPVLAAALDGREMLRTDYVGALTGQRRIGAGVPVPRYGWAVTVSAPWESDLAALGPALAVGLIPLAALIAGSVAALWYRAQVAGAAARLAAGRARPAPRPGAGWLARLLPELDLLVTLAAGREGTLTPAQARALVEQRLDQLLVAQAPVGLALIDWPAGRLLRANPAFAARLPLAAGQVVWEHLPGGPTGDVAASIRAAGQGGHPQSVRLAGVTDGERWRATPVAGTTQVGLIVLHVEG